MISRLIPHDDLQQMLVAIRLRLASLEGSAFYLAGQGGFAIGYQRLYLGLELTMGRLSGSAEVTIPSIVTRRPTDISGFVVYPAIAIMGEV